MPVTREGYMVPCRKHTDCLACGRHPLTGKHYRCQKIHTLYDTVETDNDEITFLNLSSGTGASFDIDMEDGALTGKTGVCVDLDSSMNEGCSHPKIAAAKDGIIGCADGFVAKFMCGLSVDVSHGDLSTVTINGNPIWPRVLLDGSEDRDGDGRADAGMTCSDPNDCTQKCRHLERTSRHGAGAPPTCALCDQAREGGAPTLTLTLTRSDLAPCALAVLFKQHSDNRDGSGASHLGRHRDDRHAARPVLWRARARRVHLPVCGARRRALATPTLRVTRPVPRRAQLTLQPEWRKTAKDALDRPGVTDSTAEAARNIACLNGDPFNMILQQLNSVILSWIESGVNDFVIRPTNTVVHELNHVIDKVDDFLGGIVETAESIKEPFESAGNWLDRAGPAARRAGGARPARARL